MSDPYKHWLKTCAIAVVPCRGDWCGVGRDLGDALGSLGRAVSQTVFRLILLLTFPISVPLFALWAFKREKQVERRRKERAEAKAEARNKLRQVVDKETA